MARCILQGCREKRYKDKHLCEKHWKERRKKCRYKNPDMW